MSGGGEGVTSLKYKGFWYALFDAFNPWDIIKMTARGFRWLFVGYRRRFEDSSYEDHFKMDPEGPIGYAGPPYAGTGEAATELRSKDDARGRRDTSEDDRAGLLRDQNSMGRMTTASPYRTYTNDAYISENDSQMDLSAPGRQQRPPYNMSGIEFDAKPSEFDSETAYHPRMGPSAGAGRADPGGAVHPAYRHGGGGGGWPLSDDAESIRPPPNYRMNDAYR